MSVITKEVKELTSKIDFSQLKNKSVLITGASGLVGVYMVACLKTVCEQYNIKIYNVSPNSFIDCFEKITYREFFTLI